MQIRTIIRSYYRKFEESLVTLANDIVSIVDKTIQSAPAITRAIADVKADLQILNKAIYRNRKSEYTKKLADADSVRDSSYDVLIKRIDSDLLRVKRPEIKSNAEQLDIVIRKVGRAKVDNYPDQSTQLNALFYLLDQEENSRLIDANGMRDLYDDCKEAQREFQTLWNNRIEDPVENEKIPDLRTARETLIDTLENKLFKRLDINADDEGEPYTSLISSVNTIIELSEQTQRSRINRSESEPEPAAAH